MLAGKHNVSMPNSNASDIVEAAIASINKLISIQYILTIDSVPFPTLAVSRTAILTNTEHTSTLKITLPTNSLFANPKSANITIVDGMTNNTNIKNFPVMVSAMVLYLLISLSLDIYHSKIEMCHLPILDN